MFYCGLLCLHRNLKLLKRATVFVIFNKLPINLSQFLLFIYNF
ncbi:hypothetical protein LLB_0320 [Legionella longbeachae D-4968]|nr:hypothetical protein LLB_0320 [Legionella longbeachae D-4968]